MLIYLEGCGSVLVLGASPPLGYENSFTCNEINSKRGKTDPLNWPTCHGALPAALTACYELATAAVASRESFGPSSLLSISPFFLPASPSRYNFCFCTMLDCCLYCRLTLPGRTIQYATIALKRSRRHLCRTAKLLAGY